MAVGPDPLERATEALRDSPDAEWPSVGAAVHRRVGRLVRPSATLLTVGADGDPDRDGAGSRTFVSARVVVATLRERLGSAVAAPREVRLDVEGDRCTGATLTLVGAYGTDLRASGEAASQVARWVLVDLLGPVAADVPIAVQVVDVVVGDPRTT